VTRAKGPVGAGKRSLPNPAGDDLRRLVQSFVRSFGLLARDQTPCGQPLATSHAHALMVLLEWTRQNQQTTQRDLGRALGIDKSNVARLCQRMVEAGHLVQGRCADDGRARLLSLTKVGERVARRVESSSRDRFQRLMAAIPATSRAGVLASLAALNQALAAEAPPRRTAPALTMTASRQTPSPLHD